MKTSMGKGWEPSNPNAQGVSDALPSVEVHVDAGFPHGVTIKPLNLMPHRGFTSGAVVPLYTLESARAVIARELQQAQVVGESELRSLAIEVSKLTNDHIQWDEFARKAMHHFLATPQSSAPVVDEVMVERAVKGWQDYWRTQTASDASIYNATERQATQAALTAALGKGERWT